MANMGKKLRDLIDKGEHFITGDTFSAITGRIVEYAGFPAAYLGGHACSAFHYAVPDNGVFSQVEQIEQASRIANVINIPLIADADTLGETVADAYHFTRRYIQQGIAGFHVEDERNPKHSKHVNGLWSIADQQARICLQPQGEAIPVHVVTVGGKVPHGGLFADERILALSAGLRWAFHIRYPRSARLGAVTL